MSEEVHATAVAWEGRAVLLRGPSGSGKSTLAALLIGRGATLIADDRVRLFRDGDQVMAAAAPGSNGLLELRGRGLLPLGDGAPAPVALVVDLNQEPERLPEPAALRTVLLGATLARQPVPADCRRAELLTLAALTLPPPIAVPP